jgi:hypothetical protein
MSKMKESIDELVNSGESKESIIKALLGLDSYNNKLLIDFESRTGQNREDLSIYTKGISTMIYEAICKIDKKMGKSLIAKMDY